ncbi:UBC core domain-containing protein [Forsythia ovata]|uniref:UBC core domain-containing protein n=1 Tax=Forsythia ovata TaxID=205694 RepID=A0ABD1T3J4_9LAMI
MIDMCNAGSQSTFESHRCYRLRCNFSFVCGKLLLYLVGEIFWTRMSGGIVRGQLADKRKAWRKNHPHSFVAKLETLPHGTVNLMAWHCTISGKQGTNWEGGYYPLTMHFSKDYPSKPPKCKFPQGFFYPNVYPSELFASQFSMKIVGGDHQPLSVYDETLTGTHARLLEQQKQRINLKS